MENQTDRNNPKGEDENKSSQKKNGSSALQAASMGRSATAQVDAHSNSGLANTGTNISYEGPTAPGAGGSVGIGYASGKEATGEKIATNTDYDKNRGGRATEKNKDEETNTGKGDLEEVDYDEESHDDLEDDQDEDEWQDEEDEMR